MASTDHLRIRGNRSVTVCVIVVLSVVLAAGVLALFGAYEFSVGELPEESRDFHGSVKNGELWFTTQKADKFPFTLTPSLVHRVNRLNLQTGIISATDLQIVNGFQPIPVWIGETLYVCAGQTIFEAADRSLTELPPVPMIWGCLFEFDGIPTTIRTTTGGGFQLAHWTENQWTFGRKILLPDVERLWYHNFQRDRIELRPLTSDHPSDKTKTLSGKLLFVVKQGQQYHLMLTDSLQSFAAYRSGFEFADDNLDAVSALAPENAQHDVSGWEPVFPGHKDFQCVDMKCDLNGPLFLSNYPRKRVVRRLPDGTWDEVELGKEKVRRNTNTSTIAASPREPNAYLITLDWGWSSAKVFQIEGKSIHPANFEVPGFKYAYFARCVRLLAELGIAWAVHIFVLAAGLKSIQQRTGLSQWEFGHQVAALASVRRRLFALVVDAGLIYVTVWLAWCSWRVCFFPSEPIGRSPSIDDFAGSLRYFRYNLQAGGLEPLRIYGNFLNSPVGWLIYPFDPTSDFLGALVATLLMLFSAKILCEAFYGITPGKWLAGIRTVRSTLRPCGIGPAIIRNVLYPVDFPIFLTPIPAAFSLMLSDHRQRLGDRVADTVVIRAGSIREN